MTAKVDGVPENVFWRRFRIALTYGASIGLVTHALFAVFFFVIGSPWMVIFNIASVAFYVSVPFIYRHVGPSVMLALATLEIVTHAGLATMVVGWESGFHYYLYALAPLTFFDPRLTLPQKVVYLTLICFAYIVMYMWGMTHPPQIVMEGMRLFLVHNANVFALFAALGYFAYYFSQATQQSETQLRQLAGTDSLTGLYNRRGLEEAATHELAKWRRSGVPLSLVILDVDDFKTLNDRRGHACGDLALRHVARCLHKSIRGQDYAARWGGEEFVLLLMETESTGAAELAERVRKLVARPFHCDNAETVTLTAGVSEFRHGDTLDTVLARADEALLEGKRTGKNCVRVA